MSSSLLKRAKKISDKLDSKCLYIRCSETPVEKGYCRKHFNQLKMEGMMLDSRKCDSKSKKLHSKSKKVKKSPVKHIYVSPKVKKILKDLDKILKELKKHK